MISNLHIERISQIPSVVPYQTPMKPRNSLYPLLALLALSSQGFGANISSDITTSFSNMQGSSGENSSVVYSDTSGSPILKGTGYIAIGTFNLNREQIAALPDAEALQEAFHQFGNAINFNALEDGAFQGNASGNPGELYDGANSFIDSKIYVVIGNGDSLGTSSEFLVWNSGSTFDNSGPTGNSWEVFLSAGSGDLIIGLDDKNTSDFSLIGGDAQQAAFTTVKLGVMPEVITLPKTPVTPPLTNPTFAGAGSAGKYFGFLSSPEGEKTLGHIRSIKIAHNGKFSAKMYYGETRFVFKGQFKDNGSYEVEVTAKNGSHALVALQLVETEGGGLKIEGTVTVDGQESGINVVKAGNTLTYAGAYTLLLPGNQNDPNEFQGHGYGLMKLSSTGFARIRGLLPDGRKWTARCTVTPDGEMPLYKPLYRKIGFLSGMVRFRDVAGLSDCDGLIQWRRPSSSDIKRQLIGARFDFTSGQRLLNSNLDTGTNVRAFVGAGIGASAVELDFKWSTANKIYYQGPEKFKLKVSRKNGLLRGSAAINGGKWKIEGVVFQKQNFAAGMVFKNREQPRSIVMVPLN